MRLALFLLLLPALAYAQPAQPAKSAPAPTSDERQMADNDCARARRLNQQCVITITGGEDIEGGVKRPEGEILDARTIARHQSLIRIRRDFIAEILKTANDVD